MFKRFNWQLSLVVAIVSICSLVLIQQYVIAQSGWVDPDTLPGVTPSNVFVVNPLGADLDLNSHTIFGTNIDIKSVDNNVVTIKNNKNICFTSTTGVLDCKNAWPVVSGGITGGGSIDYIPIFTGTGTSIGNSQIKKKIAASFSEYEITGDGALKISNNRDFIPLQITLGDFFNTAANQSVSGIYLNNPGKGAGVKIVESNGSQVGSADGNKVGLYIVNSGTGKSLRIDSTNPGLINKTSPLVVDAFGKMGIGTSTPNKQLHIVTPSTSNAEIDIQTGTTANGHWGIYHDNATNDLFFWKDPNNRVIFTDNGNINLQGSICDINGNNCLTPAVSTNYWTKEATSNTISRAESNVYLIANGLATFPAGATGSSSRFVWYPNKSAIRAGAVNTTYWDEASIGTYSTAFGYNSQASASKATVSGGESNRISDAAAGTSSTIGGGYNNQIIKSVQGTIAGGGGNSIGTGINSKNGAFIGGGVNNLNNGSSGVIGGGSLNSINDGENSVIGGGYQNVIAGQWSAIVGGSTNNIGYPAVGYGYSFIGGGENNITTAAYVTIGGGYNNSSAGKYASILGGDSNKADGDYSFAGGKNMQLSATADRTFAWGYSETPVSITRDNSVILFPSNPAGNIPRLGIGTANPNSTVHIKSNSGNAEIDIQSGSSNWWAMYQDDASDELRFWHNGNNEMIFSGKGLGVVSNSADGMNNYIQLDQVTAPPIATDCNELSEYGQMIFMTDPFLDAGTLFICNITGWSRVNLSFS